MACGKQNLCIYLYRPINLKCASIKNLPPQCSYFSVSYTFCFIKSQVFPVSPSSLSSTPKTDTLSISQELKEKRLDSQNGAMTDIPHHLKSKAAATGRVRKAAKVLAATVFTVRERCTCTVSVSTRKDIETGEASVKPKFDERRMALIHGKYSFNDLLSEPCLIMKNV